MDLQQHLKSINVLYGEILKYFILFFSTTADNVWEIMHIKVI